MTNDTTSTPRLWDVQHPYYLSPMTERFHRNFDSWDEFIAMRPEIGTNSAEWDLAYNLVVRWDWCVPDEADELDHHELRLLVVMQRKSYMVTWFVHVQPEDESRVREWLQPRFEHLCWMWEPLQPKWETIFHESATEYERIIQRLNIENSELRKKLPRKFAVGQQVIVHPHTTDVDEYKGKIGRVVQDADDEDAEYRVEFESVFQFDWFTADDLLSAINQGDIVRISAGDFIGLTGLVISTDRNHYCTIQLYETEKLMGVPIEQLELVNNRS